MALGYIIYGIVCGMLSALAWFGAGGGVLSVILVYAVSGQLAIILLATLSHLSDARGNFGTE